MPPEVAEGLTVLDVAPGWEDMATTITAGAAGHPWWPILVLAIAEADVPARKRRKASGEDGRRAGPSALAGQAHGERLRATGRP